MSNCEDKWNSQKQGLLLIKENKVIENLRRGYFNLQVHSIKGKHTHFHWGEDKYKLIRAL